MKTPNMPGIACYPVEFMVACGICQVRPEVFLQQFVNHIYYSSIFFETRSKIEFGVNVIIYRNFMEHLDRLPLAKDKALHVICKEQLDEIIDDPATAESTKRDLLVPVLKKFREAICQDPDQVSQINLPNGCKLKLNDSLIMICFLYGMLPEQIIKGLIDNISITMLYAEGKPLSDGGNHEMEVFYRITDGLFASSRELDKTNHATYDAMMTELYEKMKEELDVDVKYQRFKVQFRKWHNTLKHIEIKPIVL